MMWGLPAPETIKREETPLLQQVKANQNQVPRTVTWSHWEEVEVFVDRWVMLPTSPKSERWMDWRSWPLRVSPPKKKKPFQVTEKKNQQDFFFPILENETKDYKDMFCVLQNYAFSETSQLSEVFWARASTLNTGCVCERMNKWGRARGTQNKLHVSFLRLHDILSLPAFKPQDSEFLLTSWGFSSFPA